MGEHLTIAPQAAAAVADFENVVFRNGSVIKFQRIEKLDEPFRGSSLDMIAFDDPCACKDPDECQDYESCTCTFCHQEEEPLWVAADRVATASWHRRPCPMCEIVDLAAAHMTAEHPITKQEVCLACKFKPPVGWVACPATHKTGESSCILCRATPGMLEVA